MWLPRGPHEHLFLMIAADMASCPRPAYNWRWGHIIHCAPRNLGDWRVTPSTGAGGPGAVLAVRERGACRCDRCPHLICPEHRRTRLHLRWQRRCTSTNWVGIRSTWQSYVPTGGEWTLCPTCDAVIARHDARMLALDRRERRQRVGCASVTLALFLGMMLLDVVFTAAQGFAR